VTETRLHTIAALHKGGKERAHLELTALHKESQKPALYSGLSKRYTPFDEEDLDRPMETNERVQLRAQDVADMLYGIMQPLWDTEATLDATNQKANADLVVDGVTLAHEVPATYLLFLQKQLDYVRTFIEKLPTLPLTEDWVYDPAVGHYVTLPVKTVSNRKKTVPLVLHPGNDRHPPQVQAHQEDVPVGTWETVKRSGALPVDVKGRMLRRVNILQDAVKAARERANMTPVVDLKPAATLLDFLLNGGGA
jgi:hypothetical protein